MTKDEKLKLINELNEICSSKLSLKEFRRVQKIKSLLNSDGMHDNLRTVFDSNLREFVQYIEHEDGTMEKHSRYLAKRN